MDYRNEIKYKFNHQIKNGQGVEWGCLKTTPSPEIVLKDLLPPIKFGNMLYLAFLPIYRSFHKSQENFTNVMNYPVPLLPPPAIYAPNTCRKKVKLKL